MSLSAGVPRWVATLVVVAVCLLPLLVLSIQLGTGQLGPDPAKRLMQGTLLAMFWSHCGSTHTFNTFY